MPRRDPATRIIEFMNAITELSVMGGGYNDLTPPEIVFALKMLIDVHSAAFNKIIEEKYGTSLIHKPE